MVANEFLNQYRSLQAFNYAGVEDFPDRLSFLYTVTILMVCCTIVTVRTYFFHPLSCYVPSAFGGTGGAQELYVNNFCWTEGTYAVHPRHFALDTSLPDSGLGKYRDRRITYYQWVPLVLGIQCVFFYLPRLLWCLVAHEGSSTDVSHVIQTVREACECVDDQQEKLMGHACRRLELLLQRRGRVANPSGIGCALPGNRLVLFYLGVKCCYLGNAVVQLALMRHFLGQDESYRLLGLRLLTDLANGVDWRESLAFPRVGSCAVFVSTGAGGHWQASQCALAVNMINEKIFVFLWFWLLFVAVATAVSAAVWTVRIFSGGAGADFVRRCARDPQAGEDLRRSPWLTKFELEFLRNDGAFLLKMVAINCGELACSDLLLRLWRGFLRQRSAESERVSVKGVVVIRDAGDFEKAVVHAEKSQRDSADVPQKPRHERRHERTREQRHKLRHKQPHEQLHEEPDEQPYEQPNEQPNEQLHKEPHEEPHEEPCEQPREQPREQTDGAALHRRMGFEKRSYSAQ